MGSKIAQALATTIARDDCPRKDCLSLFKS